MQDRLSRHSFATDSISDYSTATHHKQYFFKYKWSSNWEYILTVLCFCITPEAYLIFVRDGHPNDPTIMQNLLTFIFVGLPIYYMQVVLGQFSQNGILFFQYMAPIGRGLGYTFLLNISLYCIKSGCIMADFLMYFLISMQPELPWIYCPEGVPDQCFSGKQNETCKKDCIDKNTSLSAYVYWRRIYMDSPSLTFREFKTETPNLQRFVSLCACWIFIYMLVVLAYKKWKKVLYVLFSTFLVCIMILLIGVLFAQGTSYGVLKAFVVEPSATLKITKWIKAINAATSQLALSQPFHVSSGSSMKTEAASGLLVCGCMLLIFGICFLCSFITHASMGIICYRTYTDLFERAYFGPKSSVALYFVINPQGLGYLSVPQMWSVLYFCSGLCMLVFNMVTHLMTIQQTITTVYPNFYKYRMYVFAGYCIIGVIVGGFVLPEKQFVTTNYLFHESLNYVNIVSVFIMILLVFWVYGVQRLSDDVHFIMGYQPTKFWKICWYILPGVYMGLTIQLIYVSVRKNSIYGLLNVTLTAGALSPTIIFMVIQIFIFVRKRRLIGLVQPGDDWGPPDPEGKQMRAMFNPRKEVRWRSRRVFCQHNCLLESKALRTIIQQEASCRKDLFDKYGINFL